ncbi:MAG TPA: isoprenylcysteine carboxylmethyltransferase family protein [Flavitalea sp.]|nr:isoprenylcysteine carboxylmethyltransferase family protein [Flavitalea sp.]HTF27782.1 isoprenylcysteine carboxylmethyltransferase family protein [Flavitalea sp.]
MKIKALMPDGYFVILLAMSILFDSIFPIVKIIFYPYSLIGIILIIIGLSLTFVANFILLKKKTSIKPLEKPSELIISGPFKFSRNPIYLGMALILFGVEIVLGWLSPFLFPIMFVIIINKSFIPIEENNLEKLFGGKYLDYKKRVRRWI